LAGVPYTFTAHAKDIYHEEVDCDHLAAKIADAHSVVTVSDFNLRHLEENYQPPRSGFARIYNGLDLPNYEFSSPHHRPRRILAVGRLVEKKGFDVLLEACGQLAADGVDFQCDLVGGGDLEDALRGQCERLGLGDRVHFRGPLPQDEVFALMRDSSLLACPCVTASTGDQDGLPTVLLEAMAHGLPCVGTDVTGVPEAILDGRTGSVVPQRDAQRLAIACRQLLDDAELRVAYADAARKRVEETFSVHASAAALRRLLAAAIEANALSAELEEAVA
ncbi:MAG: glycosyltransferase family 4 protein, partial [Planctomycetales bacterium]|nr:glycosyltransferase family 4 protein [Planctomycetales bacterium]